MAQNRIVASSALPQVLVSTRIASTSDTVVYVGPDNSSVEIAQGTVANTSASSVAVGVAIGKAGQSAYQVVPKGYSLKSYDSLTLNDILEGHLLAPGDSIVITAGTANVIDVVISGTVWS